MSKIKYKFKMFAAKYLRSFDLAVVSPLRYPGIGGSKKHQAQTEIIRNFFHGLQLNFQPMIILRLFFLSKDPHMVVVLETRIIDTFH